MAVHPFHRTVAAVEETARTAISTARDEGHARSMGVPPCLGRGASPTGVRGGARAAAAAPIAATRRAPRHPAGDLDHRLQGGPRRGAVARAQQPRLRRSSGERCLGPRGDRRSDPRHRGSTLRDSGLALANTPWWASAGPSCTPRIWGRSTSSGWRQPGLRRLGLGRVLTLVGLWDLAERQGATTAMLYVDAANTRGLRLYEGLGFYLDHVDRAWCSDGDDAAVWEPEPALANNERTETAPTRGAERVFLVVGASHHGQGDRVRHLRRSARRPDRTRAPVSASASRRASQPRRRYRHQPVSTTVSSSLAARRCRAANRRTVPPPPSITRIPRSSHG